MSTRRVSQLLAPGPHCHLLSARAGANREGQDSTVSVLAHRPRPNSITPTCPYKPQRCLLRLEDGGKCVFYFQSLVLRRLMPGVLLAASFEVYCRWSSAWNQLGRVPPKMPFAALARAASVPSTVLRRPVSRSWKSPRTSWKCLSAEYVYSRTFPDCRNAEGCTTIRACPCRQHPNVPFLLPSVIRYCPSGCRALSGTPIGRAAYAYLSTRLRFMNICSRCPVCPLREVFPPKAHTLRPNSSASFTILRVRSLHSAGVIPHSLSIASMIDVDSDPTL
mmetsp:Transcript_39587/g.79356  ORF Transcript_39587/g.79356 Transcript_39587/m.79356 type:complete len:277 (-) Transcript_39587:145-975(-)